MKTRITIVLICIVIGLVAISSTKPSSNNYDKHYSVKLYSGEKVVASWIAVDFGQVEYGTLTFNVIDEMATNTRQVRINGTYSIEKLP